VALTSFKTTSLVFIIQHHYATWTPGGCDISIWT